MMQRKGYEDLRERLSKANLPAADLKLLNDLLDGAEESDRLQRDESGKVLVARLPFGMEVVK